MSSQKLVKLCEIEKWRSSDFKSFDREMAVNLFSGVCQVPKEWNRVYVISDEDFQIAMGCVNAAITAAKEIEELKKKEPSCIKEEACVKYISW